MDAIKLKEEPARDLQNKGKGLNISPAVQDKGE